MEITNRVKQLSNILIRPIGSTESLAEYYLKVTPNKVSYYKKCETEVAKGRKKPMHEDVLYRKIIKGLDELIQKFSSQQ